MQSGWVDNQLGGLNTGLKGTSLLGIRINVFSMILLALYVTFFSYYLTLLLENREQIFISSQPGGICEMSPLWLTTIFVGKVASKFSLALKWFWFAILQILFHLTKKIQPVVKQYVWLPHIFGWYSNVLAMNHENNSFIIKISGTKTTE